MKDKYQERFELYRSIRNASNDLRGILDGWDFRQYVLGMLFYRFISESLTSYVNEIERNRGEKEFDYAKITDKNAELFRSNTLKQKGFYILPSELFVNVCEKAHSDSNLNETLFSVFRNIEDSAKGTESENNLKGLFDAIDVNRDVLGTSVANRNELLAKIINAIGNLKLGNYGAVSIDLFGDAYEYLISMYEANAGRLGGEFFTPQEVAKLLTRIAVAGKTEVNKVYDPTCGSGSLLVKFAKVLGNENVREGFFGQEINHTTYNLARMNMLLHNINYDKFNIKLGDTLIDPHFGDDKPFDAIVSNPPYSVKWIGSDDPTLINDDRFAPAGVLAPKSKADFAFVLHALSYLSSRGRAAIVCFPGIFYRGGAEQQIRKYLVDNNYVETVISLAPNLFSNTSIAVTILVLAKNKKDTTTQFIDASGLLKKEMDNNTLTDEHIEQIMTAFDSKSNIDHFARSVPLEEISTNDYNLSVSSYVEAKDNREVVDITQLNSELKTTVAKIDQLRKEIDMIVSEIEGEAHHA